MFLFRSLFHLYTFPKCIHFSKICDGTMDCPEGSDEFCDNIQPKNIFILYKPIIQNYFSALVVIITFRDIQ